MLPRTTHVTATRCPTCESKPSTIIVDRQHSNGDWNEVVKFGCGFSLHYIPNYQRIEETTPCRKNTTKLEIPLKVVVVLRISGGLKPEDIDLKLSRINYAFFDVSTKTGFVEYDRVVSVERLNLDDRPKS